MSGAITVDIKTDYGALLVGGLLAFGLSGCVNMQFIVYWQIYSGDSWTNKSLVLVTWFLDLCHSVFVAVAVWDSVIASYSNLESVDTIPWSVGATVELTATVAFLVQSFYAYRIYKLQRGKLMVASPVFALAFIRFIAAAVSAGEMFRLRHYSGFIQSFPAWVFTLGLALSAFIDIVITICLCCLLRSNRSMVPRVNRIIDNMTFWTVQNGLITCLAAILTLISLIVMPYNRIYVGFHFFIAKAYANSLLATLNARSRFRRSWKYNSTPSAGVSDVVFGHGVEQDGTVISNRREPHTRQVDSIQLEPSSFGNANSTELNVEQMIESEHDELMNIVSPNAQSKHKMEEP